MCIIFPAGKHQHALSNAYNTQWLVWSWCSNSGRAAVQSASVCERDPRLRFPGGTSFVKCKCEDVELELTSSRRSCLLQRAFYSGAHLFLSRQFHSLTLGCLLFFSHSRNSIKRNFPSVLVVGRMANGNLLLRGGVKMLTAKWPKFHVIMFVNGGDAFCCN